MTQRLVLSALTVLTVFIMNASPAQSGHDDGEQFYPTAQLDRTQVETEEEREDSCDLWYFEDLDLLACK